MFLTMLNFIYNVILYLISCVYFILGVFHAVLPMGMDVGLFGVATYLLTKCRKPDPKNVLSIFGPLPGKENDLFRGNTASCIAHRGAAMDAPENTLEALKYCIEQDCKFIEFDVRTTKDSRLILLHDSGLERISNEAHADVQSLTWDSIKNIDIGAKHPNRHKFKEVRLCLLDEAVDYLLDKKAKMILDVKGNDKAVINGILDVFARRSQLYSCAAVTCFNPYVLYQIRKQNPEIVGAMSYRPYCFSAHDYDADTGPNNPRFSSSVPLQLCMRAVDVLHNLAWRWSARWCGVSAVLLHKNIVSPAEVQYWRDLDIRCIGWCVNRPVEKLYWRNVLRAPYLANTLIGEPELEDAKKDAEKEKDLVQDHHANSLEEALMK